MLNMAFPKARSSSTKALTWFTRSWPEPDRQSLTLPEIRAIIAASQAEAFRQGVRGLIYDVLLIEGRPGGSSLKTLLFPRSTSGMANSIKIHPLSWDKLWRTNLPNVRQPTIQVRVTFP